VYEVRLLIQHVFLSPDGLRVMRAESVDRNTRISILAYSLPQGRQRGGANVEIRTFYPSVSILNYLGATNFLQHPAFSIPITMEHPTPSFQALYDPI
jgi:hypothetical protein